jgi:hypothetical protein
MTTAYKVDFQYSNTIELLDTMLSVYSLTALKKPLSDRERQVLREYILNGFSTKTKKALKISLKINDSNLNTLNYKLKQKGFLLNHPTNQKLKELNKDLTEIKNVFMSEEETARKLLIINTIRK